MKIMSGYYTQSIGPWRAVGTVLLIALVIGISTSILRRGEPMSISLQKTFETGGWIDSLAASPDGQLVVVTGCSPLARLIDVETGKVSSLNIGSEQQPRGVAMPIERRILAFGVALDDHNAALQVWETHPLGLRNSISLGRSMITSLLFSPDGSHLYCECLWTKDRIRTIDIHTGDVKGEFSPSRHGTVAIDWDHENVNLLAVAPDGRRLVIGTWMRAHVWNLQTASEDYSCKLSTETTCMCAAVSPDGSQLATGGDVVEVWDFHTGKRVAQAIKGIRGRDVGLAFSPNGNLLVAGISDGVKEPSYLVVWRVADYSYALVIPCHKVPLKAMSFFPGTNRIVTGSSDGTVSIWDLDRLSWDEGTSGSDFRYW